jgi:alcohol dehydrogenase
MQQTTLIETDRIETLEVPDLELSGGADALVRALAVATCDLDGPMIHGKTPFRGPFPLGHEGIGEVVAVGGSVGSFKVGDRVAMPFQISCGACANCKRGHTAYCSDHGATGPAKDAPQMYGIGPTAVEWGGFLSDLIRIPFADAMLVPVPGDIEPATIASLSDNIVDGYRTVAEPLETWPGAPVLIAGGGSISLYAAAIALTGGAERVDYVDTSVERLERAERIGANCIQVEGSWPDRLGPYPVTVDGAGLPEGLLLALRSTAHEGTCTSIGIYWKPLDLPLFEMYTTGITFKTGIAHARPDMPKALELVGSGRLHPELVTAKQVGWDDAVAALTELDDKLVITR